MKTSNLCLLLVAVLTPFISAIADEEKYAYKFLKEFRPELNLPTISEEQRKKSIEVASFVYNQLYTFKDIKKLDFGSQASPIPQLQNLERHLDALSDKDFYKELIESYLPLRDLHSLIVLPAPYACHKVVLPFSFKAVRTPNGKEIIAIDKFAAKEYFDVLTEKPKVLPGDELISYQGAPIEKFLSYIRPYTRGANHEAQERTAVQMLSYRSMAYDFAPEEDEVQLVLKNSQGEEYSITVPWIGRQDKKCVVTETFRDQALAPFSDFNQTFTQTIKKSDENVLVESKEPTVKYRTILNQNGSFGLITIDSFYPLKLDAYQVVDEIERLLVEEFHSVDGLIIDVRDNRGGLIYIGEGIVRLFSPNHVTPMNFRFQNTTANFYYWNKVVTNPDHYAFLFTELLRAAATDAFVEAPLLRSSSWDYQVFFKPVAILNNAICYSTCDILSAQVQDHEAGTVFGEDSTTGAGGANNWDYSYFYNNLPRDEKGPFKKMPVNMDISLSYRQAIRVGKNKGKLIENVGVTSDYIVKPTIKDLRTHSSQQYDKISSYLKDQSTEYGWAKLDPSYTTSPNYVLTLKWENTHEIQLWLDGVFVKTLKTNEIENGRIVVPADRTKKNQQLQLIGFFQGKKVWKKLHYVMLPSSSF